MIELSFPELFSVDTDAVGEPLRDGFGELIVTGEQVGALSPETSSKLASFVRPLVAAHIEQTTIVLLFPGAELWGYRNDVDPDTDSSIGTWSAEDPAPGQVWQPEDPVFIDV